MPRCKPVCLCLVILASLMLITAPAFAAADLAELTRQVEPAVGIVRSYDANGEPMGLGSGFFISADGEFVTNRHIVAGSYAAVVEMADGTRYKVKKVLAANSQVDLVKLRVETRQQPVPFLKLFGGLPAKGERIAVFDNPQGMKLTVSDGIVSAFRQDKFANTFIQFTAPASPGNSGGPLVNMNGDVVGIVTFGIVDGQNLNFALPAYQLGDLAEYTPAQDGQGPLLPPMGTTGSSVNRKPVVLVNFSANLERGLQNTFDAVYNLVNTAKYQLADYNKQSADIESYFARNDALVFRDLHSLAAFGTKFGYDYILATSFRIRVIDISKRDYTSYYTYRLDVRIRIIDVRRNQILYTDSFAVIDRDRSAYDNEIQDRMWKEAVFRLQTVQIFN